MLARVISIFFFLSFALPLFAVATAIPRGGNECNVGTLNCCNTVQEAESVNFGQLLGPLGVLLGPIIGLVGLTCNPISVIGAGGNSCSAQPVCCENNHFSGLIAVGCTPVNVNL